MKTISPRTLLPAAALLASLSACTLFTPQLNPPSGVANITPNSGPWQFTVSGHPEEARTYTMNFAAKSGTSWITVTDTSGNAVLDSPISWSSGNFSMYINSTVSGVTQTELFAMAIESATQMNGVYTYNYGGYGSTTASPTGFLSNGLGTYQATCTATFGAASPAPSASPSPAASPAASPAPSASASPAPSPSASSR